MSPTAPRRPCAGSPTCPNTVTGKHSRCPAHRRQAEQARGTPTERGYDSRWARYSKAWLARHPLCGQLADGTLDLEWSVCAREGRTTAARCTDHRRSLKQGGSQYDPANSLSLCRSCNARKSNKLEHAGWRRRDEQV
jgi:5-methylcytosine-specific restriction protein A